MANEKYKLVKNTTVQSVKDNKQYDPELVFSFKDPLDPNQDLEKSIRLWTSEPDKRNEVSESVLNNQAQLLGELLGDDTITFAAKKEDAEDTDIRNWLEKNGPTKVEGIYQNKTSGYFRIGEPRESDGTSFYRERFNPTLKDGIFDFTGYDPKSEFVRTYEALDQETKNAFDDKDKSFESKNARIWVAKSGKQGIDLTNTIVGIVFQQSNNFNDRDNVQTTTREKFLNALHNKLSKASDEAKENSDLKLEEIEAVQEKMKQNPNTVSFADVMRLVGGKQTPRLHEDLHTSVQKWITLGAREALSFYIVHEPSLKVYRSSMISTPTDYTKPTYNNLPTSLEFFKGDLSVKDITEFVTDANIVGYEDIVGDIIENTLDGDITNVTKNNNVYDFLNELLLNRKIVTSSSNSLDDPSKMPTRVNSIGAYNDVSFVDEVTNSDESKEPSDKEIEDATSVFDQKSEDAPKEEKAPLTPDEKADDLDKESKQKPKQESKEEPKKEESSKEDSNPWGDVWENSDDDPFS